MSKITNDGSTRSGTGCFIAVAIWQQWESMANGNAFNNNSIATVSEIHLFCFFENREFFLSLKCTSWWWCYRNFGTRLVLKKTRNDRATRRWKNFKDMFSRSDTTSDRDRWIAWRCTSPYVMIAGSMLARLMTLLRMWRRLLSSWANGVTKTSWLAGLQQR